ncbi:Molybdenum cofactor guanylyltransferase [Candidatus Desulfarcum epimagneticum]|uniref:Probable molybdenum cofactor guanylyltransferase n=1 Tax=uncultured Desulfobacteraceae bacterium TaxID=218296 RepID=A0A484HIB3_9BACT|nr:Molybdenum cofactor guanylyltransferase [uncultured Desulfobacteraceae bacterium]
MILFIIFHMIRQYDILFFQDENRPPDMSRSPFSGVILAGGMNTRFSGRNKAFLRVGGRPIIERALEAFSGLFDDIVIVAGDPLEYLEYDCHIVTDIFPVRSSLTGVHAGLFYAKNPHVFFSACDTPFIRKEVIELILDRVDPGADAVIPETPGGMETLCAVYSKRCLNAVEERLRQKRFKVLDVFRKRRVKKVPEKALRRADPGLISFVNINSPDDLERIDKTVRIDQAAF